MLGPPLPSDARQFADRMLRSILIATIILLLAATLLVAIVENRAVDAAAIERYKLYLEVFVLILGGFLVAMLGIIIPRMLAEIRADLEHAKAARAAYSEAKTGFDYLKSRLVSMKLSKAMVHLQSVHTKKHFAELFPEFERYLSNSEGPAVAHIWTRRFYNSLLRTRKMMQARASDWDDLTPEQRLALLNPILPDGDELPEVG
jgi:hypothetical protein